MENNLTEPITINSDEVQVNIITRETLYDTKNDAYPTGFSPYQIYMAPPSVTQWNIIGDTQQTLHIDLPPGQCVVGARGSMQYISDGIQPKVRWGGFSLALGGDGLYKIVWTNTTNSPGYVGMTNHLPGTLIPIDMSKFPQGFLCRRESWVCHISDQSQISIGSVFRSTFSCAAKCFGGMPLVMQKVYGGSWVFLGAHGTIIQKELQPGEQIVCDGHSIVGMMESVRVDIRAAGTSAAMCCAGEGLFNTVLTGPGLVILESLPISKLRRLFPTPSDDGNNNNN